jgi:hypothetical protein
MKEITIDGVVYSPKKENKNCTCKPPKVDGMPYQIVRTYSAGVFAGMSKSAQGKKL